MMSVSVPTNLLPPLAFIDGLGGPEMLLVLGLVLGFGFWELWKLKKDKKK